MFLIAIEKRQKKDCISSVVFLEQELAQLIFLLSFFLSFLDPLHHSRWVCMFHLKVVFSDQYAYK